MIVTIESDQPPLGIVDDMFQGITETRQSRWDLKAVKNAETVSRLFLDLRYQSLNSHGQ